MNVEIIVIIDMWLTNLMDAIQSVQVATPHSSADAPAQIAFALRQLRLM